MATLSTPQLSKAQSALLTRTGSRLGQLAGLWHLTSLDAPTVAVVWTLAFAWAARVHLPLWLPVALALAAWSVYIGDRLLDARSARTPLRERHLFHWRHRRILLPLALAAAVTAIATFVYAMPPAARGRNSALAAAALLYFGSVHSPWRGRMPRLRLRLPKELLVGILFTLACAMPTWARSVVVERMQVLLPIFAFIALAWLNCDAIESWESPLRHAKTTQFAISLASASFLAAVFLAALREPRHAALLAAAASSAALLAWLDQRRHRMSPLALRAAADLVLLTPLILLVFA